MLLCSMLADKNINDAMSSTGTVCIGLMSCFSLVWCFLINSAIEDKCYTVAKRCIDDV